MYRLLSTERARMESRTPETWAGVTSRVLEQENKNLQQALHEAKRREKRHQAHWTDQVGQLRAQIETLMSRIDAASASRPELAAFRAAVQEADVRGGRLEVLLRAFGPGTRHKPDRD